MLSSSSSSSSSHHAWRQIDQGDVQVFEQIGGGGVAMVHRGLWEGRGVALKTLFDPKLSGAALERAYMDEVLVMSQLRHPNVVTFLGANMTPPNLFFVMELCERSLFEVLHRTSRTLSTTDRLRAAREIADGMAYLHARTPPIVHRDLKPQNVLEAKGGAYKICDFGLAKCSDAAAGTPAYMAPELLEARPYSKAVDIYAFGVLLCELFTSAIPFREYDFLDVKRAVLRGQRPPLPKFDTPGPIKRLIQDCWNHDPTKRPPFDQAAHLLEHATYTTRDTTFTDELGMAGDCLDDLIGGPKKKT
ncbi:hypothetical protein CTAYLR_004686 [Chrysophaeum taylorii]|uniref:Protein kinase domain-containing protein n=1 Tax=Chrysophaeum taylorii TaxID=2483200 RepID=A0AAD7U7J9_9STRA|nr:hypothetical protein CTAYLR_004686 [Chrysophaeum taylorii]